MGEKRQLALGESDFYGDSTDPVLRFEFDLWDGGPGVGGIRESPAAVFEALEPRSRVYNLGIWGEETRRLIERLPSEAERRRPHLIFLYPGFNDCRRDGSPESPNVTSLADYRVLMSRLVERSQAVCETVVITAYPFDESRTTPLAGTSSYFTLTDARAYMQTLRSVAGEKNAPVVDFFERLASEDFPALLAEDGLHPNSAGHQKLCEITKEFLGLHYGAGT